MANKLEIINRRVGLSGFSDLQKFIIGECMQKFANQEVVKYAEELKKQLEMKLDDESDRPKDGYKMAENDGIYSAIKLIENSLT